MSRTGAKQATTCCMKHVAVKWFRHDDVIKWKHFPRNWSFVREIHRSPVNFPHKGQWRGALMFSLIYAWINDWVNNREAGDLRRQHGHYDVIVMEGPNTSRSIVSQHDIFERCWRLRSWTSAAQLDKCPVVSSDACTSRSKWFRVPLKKQKWPDIWIFLKFRKKKTICASMIS